MKRTAAIVFIAACCLGLSCSKDIAVSPDGECYDLPPSASLIGYTYVSPTYDYLAPCFNPCNENEFVYARENNDSFSIAELRIRNIITGEDRYLATSVWEKPDWGRNNWILFNHGDNNIWKIKSNGDSLTQLTFDNGSYDACWNNDASKYVFWQRIGSGNYYTIIADHAGNHLDTLNGAFGFSNGSWSDDQQKISSGYGGGNTINMAYLNAYTDQIELLNTVDVSSGGHILVSDWFRDSRHLLWSTTSEINITDIITRETKTIKYSCDTKMYVWLDVSPDGQKIITSRWNQKLIGDNKLYSESSIYIMNADGTSEQKITF